MTRRKINISDVAIAAGVSKATVSNFLNNRNTRFSAETASKIRKAVASLRYIPDPGARGIKSQEGGQSVGIMLRNRIDQALTKAYFQDVLPIICDTLDARGYRSLVIPESKNQHRDITYMRELAKGLIAGYFVFNIDEINDPYIEALEYDGVKHVCLGYNPRVTNFVASRHDLGVEAAVNHLVQAHAVRRIAFLPGPASQNVVIDRLRGLRAALEANRVPQNEKLIIYQQDEKGGHFVKLRKALLSPLRPDAVMVVSEYLTDTERLLTDLNLRVPDDIRLVVLDVPYGAPPEKYSHIHQRLAQVGRTAADKMLLLLEGDMDGGGVFIDMDFLPGASCGC